MQSSKYVVSDTSNISESPTEKAKERRETIILNKPDSLNDVDVIKLSGFLLYQPRKSAPNSGRAKIAAKQVTADFNFSLRSRTKPSVITSHLILAFGYALYLIYEQNRPESDSRGIVPANKPAALFFRIIAIVFSLLISFLATRKSWARKNVSTEIIFMIIILAKSLCVTCIQLMQTVPDYGQLMFDQAFVWTFLPIHPIHAGIYSIIVWLAYSIPKWFGFMPSMNGLNPLIVIAVGIIQSYAHYRRHHGLMTGYLEAKRVEIQRREMAGESSKCDGLLKSMLPPSIIHKLEMGESITPERFDSVTVIFAEICHFSIISRRASAHELVHILNDVFTTFDELIDKWKVYKVETVCQVYMAVAGCPHRDVNHASQSANFALEMISSIQYLAGALSKDMSKNMIDRRQRCVDFFNDDENLEIHVGINSGPVRAGVVGINNPRFKLFGDTVNTASRMESTCEPGRIQISPTAFELLTKSTTHAFELEKRGEIQCKGKGLITTHYVNASNEIKTTTVIETTNTNTGPSNVIESKISAVSLVSKNNERIQNDDSSIIVRDLITNDNSGGNKLDNCILRIRRLSLMIIERDIDVETLRALDKDVPLYRKLMFKKRVNWLQLKILILLMGLSFGLSSTDYWTYLKGDMTQERQIMTLLRNAVAVPIFIFLLISCRNEEWFAKYGEIFSMFSGFVAAAVMLVTIFVVYSGDPGIAAAMCILALDVELLRLSWRIILVFMLLLFYTVMIIMSRGSGVVATLATPYMVCGLFILAIHGQEHFSHLADCEKRDLEMQTKQLHQVRSLKWELLTDLLPRPIANRLLAPVPVGAEAQLVADVYEDVTVLFTDMKGFTNFSSKLDPGALQHFLNGMFSAFDEILARWGLHKIEVIGDAYFVVSGAPSTNSNKDRTPDENAGFAAETALEMVRAVAEVCGDPDVRIRVGIHTGSVVGGVVGQKDPRFHLFGHTVDLANKMEEYGEPDKVHASMDTHLRLMRLQDQHLKSNPSSKPMFETEDRGMIEIAGQPEPVHTYFVHKSSFGREQRSKERRLGKAARGNDFFTANSSLKFLGSKNKQRSSILER